MSGEPPCPTEPGTKLVGVDDRNCRIGEDHPKAKLSDADVELIRELYEPSDGAQPLTMREIAVKFEVSVGQVHNIVTFRQRATYPAGWRRVRVVVAGRERVGGVSDAVRRPVKYEEPGNDA